MRSSFPKNTAELNLRQSINKKKEIIASYSDASEEAAKLEKEILEIDESLSHVSGSLATLDTQNETSQKEIDELTKQLEEAKQRKAAIPKIRRQSISSIRQQYRRIPLSVKILPGFRRKLNILKWKNSSFLRIFPQPM